METSFTVRRYRNPIPVARHIELLYYRNAALLSLAQAARATISLMFKGFACPRTLAQMYCCPTIELMAIGQLQDTRGD